MSVGVTAIYVNLRILSILAVRLSKHALEAPRVLIRSRGRRGVFNLLFLGFHGFPSVSRRFTYFVEIGRKTAQTCCRGSFGAY